MLLVPLAMRPPPVGVLVHITAVEDTDVPADWSRKENTSPATKILVIHLTGTRLRFSAFK
jgi:hypothetical protein